MSPGLSFDVIMLPVCTSDCITPGNIFYPNYAGFKFVGNKPPGIRLPKVLFQVNEINRNQVLFSYLRGLFLCLTPAETPSGNHRGQHTQSTVEKPVSGKTTFVIMASPLLVGQYYNSKIELYLLLELHILISICHCLEVLPAPLI